MRLIILLFSAGYVVAQSEDDVNNKAYRVESAGVNSAYADVSPVMTGDDTWLFLSNRKAKGNGTAQQPRYRALAVDAGHLREPDKTFFPQRWMQTYHISHVSISPDRSTYLLTGVAKNKATRSYEPRIYVAQTSESQKWMIRPVVFGGEEVSCTHAVFGRDGKTIFVAANLPGGAGGLDIYQSIPQHDGTYSALRNVGAVVNTKDDEDYPFQGRDGTLYFSSKGHGGMGGYDVYQSQPVENGWLQPQNLGMPVNSTADDMNYVVNAVNRHGFFVSNRNAAAGGLGVYAFSRDDRMLDYDVRVAVLDDESFKPVSFALLQIRQQAGPGVTELTGADGTKTLRAPGGRSVSLDVSKEGYEPGSVSLSPALRNETITVKLKRNTYKLIIQVRDSENRFPVRSASVVLRNTIDGTEQTYYALESGVIDAYLIPQVVYEVLSNDFPSIRDQISPVAAAAGGRTIYREYFVSRREMMINVPISSDCFSSNTLVNVTNLRTRKADVVQVGDDGRMYVDMERNTKYEVEQNGKADTIDTRNLMPGDVVKVNCTFKVGQKWLVQNLYYDVNKAELKSGSVAELDKLVDVMKRHPTLEIELSSHTDCRSSMRYNDLLSAKRAISAMNYLVAKGIAKQRVIAAGYGERKLVNDCVCEPENTSACSDEQHAQNRRTEVKVLKY